jgi:crossover junction endodeoxyribonuclease RuvC
VTLILGVDPGKTGAFAVIDQHTGELQIVEDMPTIGKHVNANVVAKYIDQWHYLGVTHAVIEDVHSMPGNGHAGAFSFGRSKGVVEGAIAARYIPITWVTPAKWKRDAGLRADKDAARQLATNTWPTWADTFKRVKDDGRAEAALIALWGRAHREGLGGAA